MNCATALLTRKVSDSHMAEYRRHWDHYNPDRKGQGQFSITASVSIGKSFDEAYAQVENQFEKRKEHFSRSITDRPGDNDETYRTHRPNYEAFSRSTIEDLLDNHLLIAGTVDQCIEQISAVRNRGIDVINLSFSAADPAFARRSVELFGSEVIPAVEGRDTNAGQVAASVN
jgi:alkanesulfonate monooxygenase SsuD/methylene tetrahydromethanopterin reductase-like flavin-dependent oxidoreductase (luciferase family)